MQDLFELINYIQERLPLVKASILDDAENTAETYEKAMKYLNHCKIDYRQSYNATAEEQVNVFFNAVLDDEIAEISKIAKKQKIKK